MKYSYHILVIASLILLSGCFNVKNSSTFTYSKLQPVDYAKVLKDTANYYLIDVRTGGEYRRSHIQGAVNYNFLAFHYGRDVDSLDRSKTTFLYCQTCHRSPFAAKEMKRRGFKKVYDLKGGFANWVKAGLPQTK